MSTEWILKREEVMSCMYYYPVIIKRRHFADLRHHVSSIHGNKSFQGLNNRLIDRKIDRLARRSMDI